MARVPQRRDVALVLALALATVACGTGSAPVSTVTSAARSSVPPSTNTSYAVGVLVIRYFPLTADGSSIDIGITGDVGEAARTVRARVDAMTSALPGILAEASRDHGDRDPSALPSLTYHVVDALEFDTAVPSVPSSLNPAYRRRADYPAILSGVAICDYVRNRGVREVWIWAYQGPSQLDISESRMSGPAGDISNSYRLDDLPRCGPTYTVYTFNYGRTVTMAVHAIAHQIEAELRFMDAHLFGDVFEGPAHPGVSREIARCGSVHNPPNSRHDYDYTNATPNLSDCEAWSPDGLGATSLVSCSAWGCDDANDAAHLAYLVRWMQRFPGRGNHLTYGGRPVRNWWDVHGDFDAAVAAGRSLVW